MFDISWTCKNTWQKASYNTMWCLIGCSIGDFGTIYYFQIIDHSLSIYVVMLLAIVNGLITSIILETIILMRTFVFFDLLYVTILPVSILTFSLIIILMTWLVIFFESVIIIWKRGNKTRKQHKRDYCNSKNSASKY